MGNVIGQKTKRPAQAAYTYTSGPSLAWYSVVRNAVGSSLLEIFPYNVLTFILPSQPQVLFIVNAQATH